jgi:voltage-gated potassium channel
MDERRRAQMFAAVERLTALPMLVLSVALVPLIVIPLVYSVPPSAKPALLAVDWLIWAAFAAELVVKTYLAPRRWRYLYTHWFDVIVVVVPVLRPLRLVQSVRLLGALRLLRLGSLLIKAGSAAESVLRRHGLQYTLLLTVAVVFAAAALMTYFERNSDGSIDSFGAALWWSVTTITTVGYGDTFPVTDEGRGVAAFLMLVGITVFGLLTANIAAFLVQSERKEEAVTLADVMAKLDALEAQIAELRATPSANGVLPSNQSVAADRSEG